MPLVADVPVKWSSTRLGRRQFQRWTESIPRVQLNVWARKTVAADRVSDLVLEVSKRFNESWRQAQVLGAWHVTASTSLQNQIDASLQKVERGFATVHDESNRGLVDALRKALSICP